MTNAQSQSAEKVFVPDKDKPPVRQIDNSENNQPTDSFNPERYTVKRFIRDVRQNPEIIVSIINKLFNGGYITLFAPPGVGKSNSFLVDFIACCVNRQLFYDEIDILNSEKKKINKRLSGNSLFVSTPNQRNDKDRLTVIGKEIIYLTDLIDLSKACPSLAEYKFIVVAPFTNQTLQIEQDLQKNEYPYTGASIKVYSKGTQLNKSDFGLNAEIMTICTYDKIELTLDAVLKQANTDKFILVVDESHLLSQSAAKNFRKKACMMIERVERHAKCHSSLYMSATPDLITDVYNGRDIIEVERERSPIVHYNFIGYISKKEAKEQKIKTGVIEHVLLQTIIRRLKEGRNVFARMDNIGLIEWIKVSILKLGLLSESEIEIITGDLTVNRSISSQYVIDNSKVPDRCRLILATEVLDQAVNIKNENFCIVYACLSNADYNERNLAQVPQRLRKMIENLADIHVDIILDTRRIVNDNIKFSDYFQKQYGNYAKHFEIVTAIAANLNAKRINNIEYKSIEKAVKKLKSEQKIKISNHLNYRSVNFHNCIDYDRLNNKFYPSKTLVAHEELKKNCKAANSATITCMLKRYLGEKHTKFTSEKFTEDELYTDFIINAIEEKKETDKENRVKAFVCSVKMLECNLEETMKYMFHTSKTPYELYNISELFKDAVKDKTHKAGEELAEISKNEFSLLEKKIRYNINKFVMLYKYYPKDNGAWILKKAKEDGHFTDVQTVNKLIPLFHLNIILRNISVFSEDTLILMSVYYKQEFDLNIKFYINLFNCMKNYSVSKYKRAERLIRKNIKNSKGKERKDAKQQLSRLKYPKDNIVDIEQFKKYLSDYKTFDFSKVDGLIDVRSKKENEKYNAIKDLEKKADGIKKCKDEKTKKEKSEEFKQCYAEFISKYKNFIIRRCNNDKLNNFVKYVTNGTILDDDNGRYDLTNLKYNFTEIEKKLNFSCAEYIEWFIDDMAENLNPYAGRLKELTDEYRRYLDLKS